MALSLRQSRFLRDLHSALGTPYVWGGTSLRNGVDCSGLVQAAAELAGIKNVPRTSQQQFAHGQPVQMGGLRPGDLIFSQWGNEVGAGHVSVYIGNGRIIEAAGNGIPVHIVPMSVLSGHILGARRYLAGAGQALPNVSVFAKQQAAYHAQQTGIANPGGAGGGGSARNAAALIAAMKPVQVAPGPALPTASGVLQNMIAAHQQAAAGQSLPTASPGVPNTAPTTAGIASTLDTIHQNLLKTPTLK